MNFNGFTEAENYVVCLGMPNQVRYNYKLYLEVFGCGK